jgi:hypothetical protein
MTFALAKVNFLGIPGGNSTNSPLATVTASSYSPIFDVTNISALAFSNSQFKFNYIPSKVLNT